MVAWFLPWLLVAAVAVTTMWIAVDALGGDEPSLQAGGRPARQSKAPASPAPTPSSPDPSEAPGSDDPTDPTDPTDPSDKVKGKGKGKGKGLPSASPSPALQARGVSVQVLNGTASAGADDAMAERLAELGFEIVALGDATSYSRTTVLWSHAGAQEVAEALAARFGWSVAPKPANLSASVDIHVVVGGDEG
jgi:hypothetical protein